MILSVENMPIRRRLGDKRIFDYYRLAGLTGMDFDLCQMKDWDDVVGSPRYLEIADEIREYAKLQGIAISQSHAPFEVKYGMEFDRSCKKYDDVVRAMEFASRLGAPMIVVHSIRLPEDDLQAHFDYNLKYYRSLLPYAERFGIKIAVENLGGRAPGTNDFTQFCLGSPEMFCGMQEALNSPMVCGCLDIGHANLTTGDAPGFIRKSRGYVQYLHVHDNDGRYDMHQMPALNEDGYRWTNVPWKEVLSALRDIDYSGPMNLEVYRYIDAMPDEHLLEVMKLAASVARTMALELEK
jgi:sugar phosphate isomerase/epimerase